MMNLDGKKILIIHTAFLGDIILTTPLLDLLTESFPHVKTDFLTIPSSKNILESNPNIQNVILFDKKRGDRGLRGLIRIGKMLKEKNYDICITPHRSLRSAFLTWKTQAKIRIGYDRSAWKQAFTHLVRYIKADHEIDRNLSLLKPLGIINKKILPSLHPTTEDKEKVEKLLLQYRDSKNGQLFAVAPGSVWPTKRWPEHYYSQFCQLLEEKGIRIVLVGGPEDHTLCQRIADECQHVVSLAGQLSLREVYYFLTQCSGILTNDSAPLHLGVAAKINVFAIFGPTIPEFGFAPRGQNSFIFENKEIHCRPCAIHGGKKCPMKTFDCMESQQPEKIAFLVLERLRH